MTLVDDVEEEVVAAHAVCPLGRDAGQAVHPRNGLAVRKVEAGLLEHVRLAPDTGHVT
jgi:hypothetical protein